MLAHAQKEADKKLKVFIIHGKCVAAVDVAGVESTFEPLLTLCRRAMCVSLWIAVASPLLQVVVADGDGCGKCFLKVTIFKRTEPLCWLPTG